MFKKLMNKLFLSCLKATELIEKKFDIKLSFSERMQLKAHKMMCNACRIYEKQSLVIEKGLKNDNEKEQGKTDIEQLKKQIALKLNNAEN